MNLMNLLGLISPLTAESLLLFKGANAGLMYDFVLAGTDSECNKQDCRDDVRQLIGLVQWRR